MRPASYVTLSSSGWGEAPHEVGLSVLDWHSHAMDERGDHPIGVFKAECGHC